jgi:hypothetical protein
MPTVKEMMKKGYSKQDALDIVRAAHANQNAKKGKR